MQPDGEGVPFPHRPGATASAGHLRPFIATFACPMSSPARTVQRYDEARQVSEIWDGVKWIDAANARTGIGRETRMTKVFQETTDDE